VVVVVRASGRRVLDFACFGGRSLVSLFVSYFNHFDAIFCLWGGDGGVAWWCFG